MSVIVYSKDYCPYCVKAKNFLKHKGVAYEEIDITHDEALQKEMVEKSGGKRTVPQIFVHGTHVGGCDDLLALDKAGKFEPLLNQG